MDNNILDLARDRKMSDFADVIKNELRKKIMNTSYIKTKADSVEQFSRITDTLSTLKTSINTGI